MSIKQFHPKCKKCGRRGMLDKDLCAICYQNEYGKWSSKFYAGEKGNGAMKFKGGKKKK